jgi:hypothetical protein
MLLFAPVLFLGPPPRLHPQLCRTMLMLLLQPVLSVRVAAMFKATYGCDPVVSSEGSEPKWFAEFKKHIGSTIRPFVNQCGPWDVCVASLQPLFACAVLLLTICRYIIFEALESHFVEVVTKHLGLCGPEANDAQSRLRNLITHVLVTRNWRSHGRRLSVAQVLRALTSLRDIIVELGCDVASQLHATDIINTCIADVRAFACGSPAILTIGSVSCMFFTRSLQRLCKAINVDDITKDALASNGSNSQEMKLVKECVWDGRCYLYHGKCNCKSIALLVSTSAISRLMRSLGPAFEADADACDSDIMHLLTRMNLCNEAKLLSAIADGHKAM